MVVGDILRLTARRLPDAVGLCDGERRVTWGALDRRVNRLANALLALGLRHGERVAILCRNSAAYMEFYLAVARCGLVGVPLNTWLKGGELAFLLEDSGAAALLVEAPFAPVAATLPGAPLRIGIGPEHGQGLDLEALIAASPETPPDVAVDPEDLFVLSYTSGTTGRPKGAMISHRNACTATLSHVQGMSLRPAHVVLLHAPMFFLAAGNNRLNAVHVGCRAVIEGFEAGRFLATIERERVTHFTIGPTALQRLLDHPEIDARDLSSVAFIGGSGAPFPVPLVRRAIRRFGPVWHVLYGASETCTGTWLMKEDWLPGGLDSPRLGTVGRAAPHCEVAVRRDDGGAVARDGRDVGEVLIRGETVTRGYWRNPEATAEALEDGWFRTGDLATVDADGFIALVDRRKDMLISGGVNVYPREIEDVLYAHPDVAQCAVIGVPDAEWGETPLAVVVPRPGAAPTAAELIAHCAAALASYKKPRAVVFAEALPMTASGKVQKRELRARYAAAREGA